MDKLTVDLDDLRATVADVMAEHRIPGLSLAVTSSDRLLHHEAFGVADLAASRSVTTATRFLWFSMSKVVTATAALRLADEGRLDLDAPVSTVATRYTADGRGPEPRIRQLLDHTAGAPNPLPLRWVQPAAAPPTRTAEDVHRLLRRARPRRAVSREARYSNIGYLLLAEAIAQAAGVPFEDYVRRAVLDPAGMHATGYRHDPDADHATGYVRAPRPAGQVLRAALPRGIVGERHGGYLALRPFRVVGAGFFNLMRLYPDLDLGVVIMANTTQRYDHDALARSVQRAFAP